MKPVPPSYGDCHSRLAVAWILEVQHALATWPDPGSLAALISTAADELHIRAMRSMT